MSKKKHWNIFELKNQSHKE